jgi:hypothetical protein
MAIPNQTWHPRVTRANAARGILLCLGRFFFLRVKMGGRPSERIAIQRFTINNTICIHPLSQSHANDVWWWGSLSHTHCEGWRCGWHYDIRTPIANDDSEWPPGPAQSLNVVAKSPCLRPHGVRQVRSGCVSGTSVIIYNPQPLYNSTLYNSTLYNSPLCVAGDCFLSLASILRPKIC